MGDEQIKEVLDRVLTWPHERQQDAAALLLLIEEHDRSPYRLSDEQAAEVQRRRADTGAQTLTLAQLDDRLRNLGI
jgi:hypothetical protein